MLTIAWSATCQPEQLDLPSIEAMVALRKRELVQEVMAASRAMGLEEAVSYLQLSEWSADRAIKQLRGALTADCAMVTAFA